MTDYLLDTNHAGRLVGPRHPVWVRVLAASAQGSAFYIVLPIITETVAGFSILPRAVRNRAEWHIARGSLALLDLDETDALDAAALRQRGRQLQTVDALAAVAALRYDVILLTTDGDFATIAGLRQENWVP